MRQRMRGSVLWLYPAVSVLGGDTGPRGFELELVNALVL